MFVNSCRRRRRRGFSVIPSTPAASVTPPHIASMLENRVPMKRSDDPVVVAPTNYTIAFENECVRILRFHARPRERWNLHAHPNSVVVSMTGYQVRNVLPHSEPIVRNAQAGDIAWISARSHTGENSGETDMDCILIELKTSNS